MCLRLTAFRPSATPLHFHCSLHSAEEYIYYGIIIFREVSTTCELQAMMPIIGGHRLQLLSTLQHSRARLLGELGTHITCVIQHSVSESHIQTMAKLLVPQAHGPTPSQLIMCRWGQLSCGSFPKGLSRDLSSSQL